MSIFADGKTEVDFSDDRQKWAYYIKNIGRLQEEDVKDETGIFRKFIEQCKMSNLNETAMREYNKSILEYADVQDACITAKKDGFAEGESRGEARGRMEEKKAMASKMLKKGLPLSLVSEITGLSESDILSMGE